MIRPALVATAFLLPLTFLSMPALTVAAQQTVPEDGIEALREEAFETMQAALSRMKDEGISPEVEADLERARSLWREAARRLDAAGDEHGRSQMLVNIGVATVLLGDLEAAWSWYDRGLAAARSVGRADTEAKALNAMGEVLARRGRHGEAVLYRDSALAAIAGKGFPDWEARQRAAVAEGYLDVGDLERAKHLYETALPVLEERGDVEYQAEVLRGMGHLYARLHLFSEAIAHLDSALKLYRQVGNASGEATVLWAIREARSEFASALLDRAMSGDDCRAGFTALDSVRALAPVDEEELEHLLSRLRRIYASREGEDRARDIVRSQAAAMRRLEGALLVKLEGAGRTLERLCGRRAGTLADQPEPGAARRLRASLEAAVPHSRVQLEAARASGVPVEIARGHLHLADALANTGRVEEALAAYDSALARLEGTGELFLRARVLHALGRLHHRIREPADLASAILHYAGSAAERARLRARAGEDRFQVRAAELGSDVFARLGLALLARTGSLGEPRAALAALAATERGRAQALLDLMDPPANPLGGDSSIFDSPGPDPSTWPVPRPTREISGPAGPMDDSSRGEVEDAVRALERTLAAEGSALVRGAGAPFLYYQLAEDTLLVWSSIGEEGLRVTRQPLAPTATLRTAREEDLPPYFAREVLPAAARDSIAGLVRALRSGLGTVGEGDAAGEADRSEVSPGDAGDPAAAAAALSELLLPPSVGDLPEGTELLIVPSGPLALVPFGYLPLPTGPDEASAPRLGARLALRYAPSLGTLARMRARSPRVTVAFEAHRPPTGERGALPQDRGAAEIAPPPDDWNRPLAEALVVGNPEMPVRSVEPGKDGAARLSPLPGAEEEARWLAERLGVRPLLGRDAAEAVVRSRLSDAPLVHLATHGLAYGDERSARESFVALGPGPATAPAAVPSGASTSEPHDGRLTVGEILDEGPPLIAELVVLSACQTGMGDATGSEGTIGLQRAFLARGARNVLVSLWNVPDESTRFLMERFYGYWLALGLGKAQALRLAQRDVRLVPGWEHPVHWAAFQLVGAG